MRTVAPTRTITRRSFLQDMAYFCGAGAVGGTLLQACSTASQPQQQGSTTITLMYGVAEVPVSSIQAFEKQTPSVKVKQLEFDNTRLSAMIAADQAPDVVRMNGTDLPNYAVRGLMTDLTNYFTHSSVLKSDDLMPINDVYRWDGTTQGQGARYGIVKDWSQDVMLWYNKKLFDEAKIPYPSSTPLSYPELLDLGKRLTRRQDDRVEIYGLDMGYEWGILKGELQQNLLQVGKSFYNEDFTQVDFTTAEAKQILQWDVDWVKARVGPSPLDGVNDSIFSLFPANRLAMGLSGYWFIGLIASDKNGLSDHIGLAPSPQWGPKRISTNFGATGAWIPQQSKKKDAAWKFLESFAGGEIGIDRAKIGWGLPTLKSLFKYLPLELPYQQQAYQAEQAELPYLQVQHHSPYITEEALETAVNNSLKSVTKDKVPFDQAIQQLTDTINQQLQRGKSQVR